MAANGLCFMTAVGQIYGRLNLELNLTAELVSFQISWQLRVKRVDFSALMVFLFIWPGLVSFAWVRGEECPDVALICVALN